MELKKHCPNAPLILVGTKIDMRDDPSVIAQLEVCDWFRCQRSILILVKLRDRPQEKKRFPRNKDPRRRERSKPGPILSVLQRYWLNLLNC